MLRSFVSHRFCVAACLSLALAACKSTTNAVDAGFAMCATPGALASGPADNHCALDDGGVMAQPTNAASCHAAGIDGQGCGYGDTRFGTSAYDDDCKYHVVISTTPICEGAAGVNFTVTVTSVTSGALVTGAHTLAEVFTTTPGDASCDDMSMHAGPNSGVVLSEISAGTYAGAVEFDEAGAWTVRFHFFEECNDGPEDSPHGHAAFHVTVP